MFLSRLKIKGYKSFGEEFDISFNKGLTVLVGENGSGKTAIIDAIRLLFNEDEYGRHGILKTDFHKSFNKKSETRASSIEIRGVFKELDTKEQVAYLPWLDAANPKEAFLSLKIDNKETPRGRYHRVMWGGESISGLFEWELLESLACIYLPPLRDASSKLGAYRGSRLSRMLLNERPKDGSEHELETKVREFNKELAESDIIDKANAQIQKYLKQSLGTFLGQDVAIQFSETSFDRIVEKLRILFYPKIKNGTAKDLFREISENSLGYNNILYLATVLAELDRAKNCLHKILLIEEPEAHLHPQLQIKLMQYLRSEVEANDIQIIVTSHSSTIVATSELDSINVLTSQDGLNPISTLLQNCELEPNTKSFLERWLDITKSTLFFAKGLIFVEGIAEALVLKELSRRVIAEIGTDEEAPKSLEDYGVSIINLNGIYFKHFLALFQGYKKSENGTFTGVDFIPVRCAALTDCDPSCGKDVDCEPTIKVPCDCKNPQLYMTEDLAAHSNFCRMFSNLKTLEYDLALENGNLSVMLSIFAKWLDTGGPVSKEINKKVKKNWELATEPEKAIAANYLLSKIEGTQNKAGEKLGKGSFAQLLAEKLNDPKVKFEVPSYIKSAIYWAVNYEPLAVDLFGEVKPV